MPYEAVRTAAEPDATLLEFLQSTYEAAALGGDWDRAALECPLGEVGALRRRHQLSDAPAAIDRSKPC